MKGICKLYRIETELKNSHVIPKFAFDYMKKTGGKFLRQYENPNIRVQDGIKRYFLGNKAEQEFSKRERWFANNIFLPYQANNQQEFEYDENFSYFIISVLWRLVLEELENPNLEKEFKFLQLVANEWREFLADSKYPRNYNDIYVLLTSRLTSHQSDTQNADLYTTRYIDGTLIVNDDYSTIGIYFKFLRFMFWSIIKGPPTKGKNIKVKFTPDKLVLPQEIDDVFFGGFIFNRIKEIDHAPEISKNQEKKIIEEINKNEKDFWKTDAGLSMINDYKLRKKASG